MDWEPNVNNSYRILPKTLGAALAVAITVMVGCGGGIPDLVINEFMADNKTVLEAEDGSFPDWIELYNAGDSDIPLGGIYITDNLYAPTQWELPSDETLGPGEFMLVLADGVAEPGHAVFRLERNGEEIGLFTESGGEMVAIDSVIYDAQIEDQSSARVTDGGEEWEISDAPTPGASNG